MTENMKPTAIVFPGQGSQEIGMGRDIAEHTNTAMELWKKAEKACGADLRGIYWDGDESEMANTRWLQPALTVANLSVWMELSGSIKPILTAGHSLGEFAAFAASGALGIDDVIELVSLRGRLMSEAGDGSGAMAALLKMKQETVESVVASAGQKTGLELRIANYNTPAQFVISGHKDAVSEAAALAKEHKGRAIPLAVSGAFHSPLMAEASAEFEGVLRKAKWNKPTFPVVTNASGKTRATADELCEDAVKQMTSSVLWIQSVEHMFDAGAEHYLECGPKGVLTKMFSAILKGKEGWSAGGVSTIEQISAALS